MSVSTKVIIQDEHTKVVQFLWSKPLTVADLNEREKIEAALEVAINNYVTDNNYLLFSAHKNPLLKAVSRLVIIKANFDYPEIETK